MGRGWRLSSDFLKGNCWSYGIACSACLARPRMRWRCARKRNVSKFSIALYATEHADAAAVAAARAAAAGVDRVAPMMREIAPARRVLSAGKAELASTSS